MYRTIELPILSLSQYPVNSAQKEIAEWLHLMYVATRDYPLELRVQINQFLPCVVSSDFQKRIFEYLKISWDKRSVFVSLFNDYIIPAGEKGGLNFAPHLFMGDPKDFSSCEVKENGTVYYKGKVFMAEMRKKGLLPICFSELNSFPSRKSAAQTLGMVARGLKSHVSQEKKVIARKYDALHEIEYKKESKKISLTEYAIGLGKQYSDLYETVDLQAWHGYLIRKIHNKSVPEAINTTFDAATGVDWYEMGIYYKYRSILLWPDHAGYSPNLDVDSKPYFETTGTYHQLKSITYDERKFKVCMNMDNQNYDLVAGMSNKVLGLTINPDMTVSYNESNNRRFHRTGEIKQLRFFSGQKDHIQITINVKEHKANNTENLNNIRFLFSSSRGNLNDKMALDNKKRAKSVTEGLILMGIDINAHPTFAYHIYRLSFKEYSDISTDLPDGRSAYLHDVESGRCGEKTEAYDQYQSLLEKLYKVKDDLDHYTLKDGPEKIAEGIGKANESLSKIRKAMEKIPKFSLNNLSADYYKYLDLMDVYISTVVSVQTKGISDYKSRKEISLKSATRLKTRMRGLRKNYTNRILYEITGLCFKHNISLIAMEDLENGRKWDADDNWNRRNRLLRMEGMSKLVESRMSEIGVLVVGVNSSYTSKTYLDKHWGRRVKGSFTPYVDGYELDPIDDDINAARNIILRAVNRHENIFAITVKKTAKGAKLGDKIGNRLRGGLLKQFNTLDFPLPQNVTFKGKNQYARLYWFEDNWTQERPSHIIECRLASEPVVA